MNPPSGRRPWRRTTPRNQRRVVRVLTEGKITEPHYLSAWARGNRRNVHLDLSDTGMTPGALVRSAKQHVQNSRSRRVDPDFDEIWCVFDIDEHPNVPQAIEDARQSGIKVAVSNPCFELWLVLHVQAQTAYINRRNVQRLSKERQITREKKIRATAIDTLIEAFDTAKQRAQALDELHAGNGSPRRSNPSADVWRLVDRLRNCP